MPVGDETAERKPLSLLPRTREIALVLEPHLAAQPQSFRHFGGHEHAD